MGALLDDPPAVDDDDSVGAARGREAVGDQDRRASREQHVWRVEASRGLAHGTGVFDLSSDGAGAEADWRLVGVSD